MTATQAKFSYSGHETFVCRYAWLPKAIKVVKKNPHAFKDEHEAMVALGVGKNMVRAIKYWAESAQVLQNTEEGHTVSPFGDRLLGYEGHDQFLERPETLWLLHWKIATNPTNPLYTWLQMLNYWHRSEFTASEALIFLQKNLQAGEADKSERTLADGIRVFINSYVPTRGRKGEIAEDHLDCPLVELNLLRETKAPAESVYCFNLEDKPAVSAALFAYSLEDFWTNQHPHADFLEFTKVSTAEGSPGQIFKLPELAVRDRLEQLGDLTERKLQYVESSSLQQVIRKPSESLSIDLLDAIYES